MTNGNSSKTRDVRTTILTVDRTAIDWEQLRQSCYIVRYKMPYKHPGDKNYYPRMHNWFKQNSNYPCYLNTHDLYLYVKYRHPSEVETLTYEKRMLPYSVTDLQDPEMLPWVVKSLVADFFYTDDRFVSNAHFFLWTTADRDFVTGLEIRVNHNWRESNDEFVVADKAARLRRLRPIDFDAIDRSRKVYYGRFYPAPDMPVFKQLKPDQLTRSQLREGIYEVFEGSTSNRASLTFHSVKSLHDLRQTRSYMLNQFIERFITYLNQFGLPFQQKTLPMQAMQTKSNTEMQNRQLPTEEKPIYIVDDRINARRNSDDFAVRFCEVANKATLEHEQLFKVKAEADLQPGDWVLRLQDYEGHKEEFDNETGILKDWEDAKDTFYARHPTVVKQTLTVNHNVKRRHKEKRRKDKRNWTADEYLDYSVPTAKQIGNELEVCRNQLLLKDVVMFPEDACKRLPQVEMIGNRIFLYKQTLVHFDGRNLNFMPIANNLEAASDFVQAQTGWDLVDDVLIPSAEWYYYTKRPTAVDDTTKRPFIISRDLVWEVWEGDARVLHEDDLIRERLEVLEEPIPTKRFYPPQPIEGNRLFTATQLQAYAQFLDQHVRESTISYRDLKNRYGKDIKDDQGRPLLKDQGFYSVLGIKNETKFKRYLSEYLGLTYKSIREDYLFPVYKGIWYSPDTNHYVAGVKDSNPIEQERGHTLRKIVVHQGEQAPERLQLLLEQVFFPLMEVNFIRYRNYTVMPFPFALIEMWQELNDSTTQDRRSA